MALHFDFSAEQRMLGESVRGMLAREARTAGAVDAESVRAWGRRFAEQGLFGVMTPEKAGGLGLGLTDALAIALETGEAQARFPVIETVVAASLLAELQPGSVTPVLNGEEIVTCASSGSAELVIEGNEKRIRGTVVVPFAAEARWLALSVRRSDGNEPGPWAALVDLRAPGIAPEPAPVLDLTCPVYRLSLDLAAGATPLAGFDLADQLAVLACGEMAGAAAHCHERTLRHLKERVQFGKPIGVNQSLRHRAADDWIRVQGMQAAAEYAAAVFDAAANPVPGTDFSFADFAMAAHAAKAYCSQAARAVAENAIQSHGGIGFTWEFGLHIPVRRILRLASAFGAASDHHDAIAATLLNGNRRPV